MPDFVGDRVQGCVRSPSLWDTLADNRIGRGAAIILSWPPVDSILDKGGGVLTRGTPEINNLLINNQEYCFKYEKKTNTHRHKNGEL